MQTKHAVFPVLGTGDHAHILATMEKCDLGHAGWGIHQGCVGLHGEFMYFANANREQWGIIPLVKRSGNHTAYILEDA